MCIIYNPDMAVIAWRLLLGGYYLAVVTWWLLLGGCYLVVVTWRLLLGGCYLAVVTWRLLLGGYYLPEILGSNTGITVTRLFFYNPHYVANVPLLRDSLRCGHRSTELVSYLSCVRFLADALFT